VANWKKPSSRKYQWFSDYVCNRPVPTDVKRLGVRRMLTK